MRKGWLEEEYLRVKKGSKGSCKGCAFCDFNRDMGYDFCEEIPCTYEYMYVKKEEKKK